MASILMENNEELLNINSGFPHFENSFNDFTTQNIYVNNNKLKSPNNGNEVYQEQLLQLKLRKQQRDNNFINKSIKNDKRLSPNKNRMLNMVNNLKMPSMNNQVLPIERRKNFHIIWKNISYSVKQYQRASFQMKIRTILNGLSGYFSSGQVTAIMGPSGAGKSTFLEILACRKSKNLSGWLKVKAIDKLRIAYVPQNNYLMQKLTVFETLTFACRLNYSTMSTVNYNKVEKLIIQFGLTNIRDTHVERCSGGQQKRISIALELFSKPNLLILDEPTTGLDSSSCSLVVKVFGELVKNPKYPMAIIATIHQPSWSVFVEFHNIYIINRRGENLYLGPPQNLLPLLEKVNLPCDKYNSPPDYIIEIAAGDYGMEPVKMLQNEFKGSKFNDKDIENMMQIEDAKVIRKTPFFKSIFILMNRSAIIFKRNLMMIMMRVLAIIMFSFWLSITFGHDIGHSSGCPLTKMELYNIPLEKLSTLFEEEILSVMQNNCCLFFGLIVGLISGMTSTVLEFPQEMHIFMKEYNNGWYSCLSFYLTKTIMDIPIQITIPSIYISYIFYYTGQPKQYFREGYLLLITFLVSFVSESMGATISALFMNKPTTAAFVAGVIPMPMVLFGGFLVKYSRMPSYMQMLSWLSLMKYAFEGMMVSIYGFSRCEYNYQEFKNRVNISNIKKPLWAEYLPLMLSSMNVNEINDPYNETANMDEEEKAIFKLYSTAFEAVSDNGNRTLSFNRSVVFSYYGIEDDWIIYRSLTIMFFYLIIVKIATYFIILNKLKRGN